MSRFAKMSAEMARTVRENRHRVPVSDWAEKYGVSETYPYRVASELGLKNVFKDRRCRKNTRLKVGTKTGLIVVPAWAMFDSGLYFASHVLCRVEGNKVIVEALP